MIQGVLPTAALRYDGPFQNGMYTCESKAVMNSEIAVSHGLTDSRNQTVSARRLFASSWLPLAVQCLCSHVFIACNLQSHVAADTVDKWRSLSEPFVRPKELLISTEGEARTKNVGLSQR